MYGKNKLNQVEYLKWINNPQNGLIKDTVINNYEIKLTYYTLEQVLLKDESDLFRIDKKSFKKQLKEQKGLFYFALQITPQNEYLFPGVKNSLKKEGVMEHNIEYFSFGMQQDLKMIINKDTFMCKSLTNERFFNHTPFYRFFCVFEPTENIIREKDIQFEYLDKKLGIGNMLFTFRKEDIVQIPKLKIQNRKTK